MSPLSRLHHHDIMTNCVSSHHLMSCNVGVLKTVRALQSPAVLLYPNG